MTQPPATRQPAGAEAAETTTSGGAVVRRLLPAAVLVPAVLAGLSYAGDEADLWNQHTGDALVAVITIALFAALIFFYGRMLDRVEAERRRAELESAEAAPALAQRALQLEQANEELAAAKVQLERSNEELQRFATVASHDLREPLRVVSGFADMLGRRYGDQLAGDGTRFIEAITGGVKRMDELISDLLDYARAGRSDQPHESVDSNAVVADVLEALDVAIKERKATVLVDPLPTIRGDGRTLRQLFQNLIANAIKFAGDEAPRVKIWAAEVTGGWRFTVRDNGIGIDPEDAERIFGMFARLHSTELFPGTGVGLAVCQRIVEVHGGSIWVEQSPGGGSQFMFTISSQEGRRV